MYSLYDLIYSFFANHIFLGYDGDGGALADFTFIVGLNGNYEPNYIDLQTWLCHTASIISITIIVVLCCLFVYKIIKLIGGLIR